MLIDIHSTSILTWEELIGPSSLEAVLRGIICRKVQPHLTIDAFWYWKHDIPFLVQEFQKWEETQTECVK